MATHIREGQKRLVEVTVDTDGVAGNQTGKLVATDNHPFWIDDEGAWIPAGDLVAGDQVRTPTGQRLTVTAFRQWTAQQRVHNLTVDGIHTYYVIAGDAPVLVHNCGGEILPESKNIADHANARSNDPGGMDHYVRGVDRRALGHYVDGVLEGKVPNVDTRYLNNGRIGHWDPDKGAVVIEDGGGGTVFTPKDGKDYFDYELK